MPVEISGFAQALVRCLDFDSVSPAELEDAIAEARATLEMAFVSPSAESPLIRSGAPFTHLVFVQHGTVVPWQYPHSELSAPFLIGEHEFLMDAARWVASYSAVSDAVVVEIPAAMMRSVLERIPRVRERMHQLVMRRLARFYWTSLATTGTPASRVAAALVSRLALEAEDFGAGRTILIKQKDLVRLTTLSRSAVADGLNSLTIAGIISFGEDRRSRFGGFVRVPNVDALKDQAFAEVRDRDIRQMILRLDDERPTE